MSSSDPYGQYPPPQPYQQPPQYGPPRGPTNGMAIASLVLGILWIYGLGAILALVFGYIAKGQIRERGESGSGLATAGIVLGWIGVVGLILILGLIIVAASSDTSGY